MMHRIVGKGSVNVQSWGISVPYFSPGAQSAGMLRFNINTHNFEVYDGMNWQVLSSIDSTIELKYDAESAIKWAFNKMNEEMRYRKMAEKNPAIDAALKNFQKAEEQLKTTIILSQEHDQKATS